MREIAWYVTLPMTCQQFVRVLYEYIYLIVFMFQGRHTKTGQLAAIKVMNVTEV